MSTIAEAAARMRGEVSGGASGSIAEAAARTRTAGQAPFAPPIPPAPAPTPAPAPAPEPGMGPRTRAVVAGAAELVDLLYTGVFGMPLAATREQLTRVQRTAESVTGLGRGAKMTRKEIGEEAAADASRILEKFGSPALSLLRNLGVLKPEEKTAVEVGFDKLMQRVDEVAGSAEASSGGKVKKEDITATLNMTLGALGVKGAQVVGKGTLSKMKAREAARAMDAMIAERQAETLAAELKPAADLAEMQTKVDTLNPRTPTGRELTPEQVEKMRRARAEGTLPHRQPPADLRPLNHIKSEEKAKERRAQKRLRQAFAEDGPPRGHPSWEGSDADLLNDAALARERMRQEAEAARGPRSLQEVLAERAELRSRGYDIPHEPSRELRDAMRTGLRGPTDFSLSQGATRPFAQAGTGPRPDLDPLYRSAEALTTDRSARRRGLAETQPQATTGQISLVADSLTSALDKVRAGRLFSLTPEERIALKGFAQEKGPGIALPAAIGATGLGLALTMEPDAEEAALAVGAGALIAGRGRSPLKLEDLRALPDATPLGAIIDRSPYTLSTLEALPRNRFEFSRASIDQLLKRQEVTKAERDVFAAALASVPEGGTVTAKQLMEGLKRATGDFELKVQESDSFADYGLGNIDRKLAPDIDSRGDEFWTPEDAGPEEITRLRAEAESARAAAPQAVTRIYQSPVELGTANHFGDPNYFAHTRVFEEGGVRHVVEIQSDLAQKAGKRLTPEDVTRLEAQGQEASKALEAIDAARETRKAAAVEEMSRLIREGKGADSPEWREFTRKQTEAEQAARTEARRLELVRQEAATAIRAHFEAERSAPVEPMLKNWHKRIIREEVASAREAGTAPVIRFATADTVAKVEGWPEQFGEAARRIRSRIQTLEYDLRIATSPNQRLHAPGRPGETPEQAIARWEAELETQQRLLAEVEANERANRGNAPRFSPEHQGIYDRYAGDITKFLKQLGGREVTDATGNTWIEVPLDRPAKGQPAGNRVQLFGLAGLGAAAGLASLMAEDEYEGAAAALFGLGILSKSRHRGLADAGEAAIRGAEYGLGVVSTRLGNISQPILRAARRHELEYLRNSHDRLQAAAPFAERFRALPRGPERDALASAITTNDPARIIAALGKLGDPELVKAWRAVQPIIKELGAGLQSTGRLKGLRPEYFPRVVTDHNGLLAALGVERRTRLEKILAAAERESARVSGAELSPLERSDIINKFLRENPTPGSRPGFLKERQIDKVGEDLLPYYAPPDEALILYIRAATREVERARFFGRSLVRDPATGRVDLSTTIGNYVDRELSGKAITPDQVEEVKSILQSRFGPGERSMYKYLQDARNISYAMLLGHATSALVQFGDVAITAAAMGVRDTIQSIGTTLRPGGGKLRVNDFGLVNHVVEELVDSRTTGRALNKVFKWSGFNLVDTFGKTVTLNAARSKFQRMAQTVEGQAEIARRYSKYFGNDLPELVSDLRAGKRTQLTDELMFAELSNLQPITKLEVPQAYLNHPNGRIFYMLKTFAVKQADIMRRQVYDELRAGNKARALENATKLSLALMASGASMEFVRNLLLGRDDKLEWGDLPAALFRTYGWSEFAWREPKAADAVKKQIASLAVPPVDPLIYAATLDPRVINYTPFVGKWIWNYPMGQAERVNEMKARQEATEERKRLGLDRARLSRDERKKLGLE